MDEPDEKLKVSGKRRIVTLPIPGKSAPVIPVPVDSAWIDLLFPGHVQNPDKAIGLLTAPITDKTSEVSLKFRPRNPSCISVKAKLQPVLKLVLKVNKKSKAVRVVAVVRKEIRFTSLADFQLQYPPAPPPPCHLGIPSPLIDYDYLMKDSTSVRVNSVHHALRDAPFDYFYFSASANDAGGSSELKVRQPRPSIVIHWRTTDTEIPTAPMKETQLNMFKMNFLNEHKEKILEMFRSRPIWSTSAFANVFKLREVQLRTQLLPQFSYYCNTGPWRGMWIKFGYDPRVDTMNRKYQLIDFRAPRMLQARTLVQRYSSCSKNEAVKDEGSTCHIYRSDKLPYKRQSHYQVCDIQDSRCQAVLKNYETSLFTHSEGFYSKGALPAVRKVMVEQFQDLMQKRKENEAEPDEEMT